MDAQRNTVVWKMTLNLAMELSRKFEREYWAYREQRRAYLAAGQRPQYCEHGTNQWTDYDPMCGWCEDGQSDRDGVQRRRRALDAAKARAAEADQVMFLISEAMRMHLVEAINVKALMARVEKLLTVSD